MKQTDYERARNLFRESLIFNREVGHQNGMTASVAGLAKLASSEGKLSRAAQLYGIVEARVAAVGLQLMIMDKSEFDNGVSVLRAQMDEKTLAKFWAKGKAMSFDDAIAFALEEK